jgi:hypothetical protein
LQPRCNLPACHLAPPSLRPARGHLKRDGEIEQVIKPKNR